MTDPKVPEPTASGPTDWAAVRGRLRSLICAKLGGEDASIEDLTQEALIEIVRIGRRESIRNLDGLMSVVAAATVVDEIRRRRRWRLRQTDWNESMERIESLATPGVDPWDSTTELLWFALLQ